MYNGFQIATEVIHMVNATRTKIGMAALGVVLLMMIVPCVWAQAGSDRFRQLTKEELNKDQQRAAAEIMKQSSSSIAGPWNIMLRSPEMADRLAKLLDYIRHKTSLPLRLNEMAIMITACQVSSQYMWFAHYRFSKEAGLSEAIMADLAHGKHPRNMRPDESIVYDFSEELHRTHFVSDATFKNAKTILGEQQVVDLIAVNGAYTLIGMLLNTAEVMPNDGSRPLPTLSNR